MGMRAMNTRKLVFILATAGLLALTNSSAYAAKAGIFAKVTTILLDDVNFGGCMAALDSAPSGTGLDCADPWVSFSCTGDFNSRSQGDRKLAAAQLALVTQTTFYVVIDDTKKHNGYCFAERADNFR